MHSLPYRFLRRKLPSFKPTTTLGRLTAYVGAIWLVLHVIRLAIALLSKSEVLSGWAASFNYIFGFFLSLLLLRWRRVAVM